MSIVTQGARVRSLAIASEARARPAGIRAYVNILRDLCGGSANRGRTERASDTRA